MAVGRIQRTPRGLLQYLGMVGTGQAPVSMADDVVGILNMAPFYGSDILEGAQQNGTAQNIGNRVDLQVPTGEAWLLLAAQGSVTTGAAGESCFLALLVKSNDTNRIRVAADGIDAAVPAGSVITVAHTFPQPILLRAGNEVSVSIERTALTAARGTGVGALIYRFAL